MTARFGSAASNWYLSHWRGSAPSLPCVKGKQRAVAVVNGCPVDSQSRDRVARRQLARRMPCRRDCRSTISHPHTTLRRIRTTFRGYRRGGVSPPGTQISQIPIAFRRIRNISRPLVGAIIDRPPRHILSNSPKLCAKSQHPAARAASRRPYIPAGSLCDKHQFEVSFGRKLKTVQPPAVLRRRLFVIL